MKDLPIYFDYAATTPVDERVANKMYKYLNQEFGNPASRSHSYGWSAEIAIEEARENVANLVGCDPKSLIWTSGATESINLAIKGSANFYRNSIGNHVVTCTTEHKATLDSCRELEKQGFEVTYINPNQDGIIEIEELKNALRANTVLVSIMLVNNEIGVIQDIETIGRICKEHNQQLIFHVDAAQAAGKLEINLENLEVDLMSFSAHKVYGPKGVGALYIRRKPRIRLHPIIHGGGHERGFRSGTLPTHQIVGMGEAYRIAKTEMSMEILRIKKLAKQFWEGIKDIPEVYLNGHSEIRVPHNLNVSFNYVEGESLMMALKKLAISSGSACTSATLEPSYVLRALGRSDELAHSSLRISLGRFTTEQEIKIAVSIICEKVEKLRELSPLWEMHQQGIDLEKYQWSPTH